jgi:hypothetical protein
MNGSKILTTRKVHICDYCGENIPAKTKAIYWERREPLFEYIGKEHCEDGTTRVNFAQLQTYSPSTATATRKGAGNE